MESECDSEDIIMKIGKMPKKSKIDFKGSQMSKPFSPSTRLSLFSPLGPSTTQAQSGFRNIFSADDPPARSKNASINK